MNLAAAPHANMGTGSIWTMPACCCCSAATLFEDLATGPETRRRLVRAAFRGMSLEPFARQAFGRTRRHSSSAPFFVLAEVPIAAVKGRLERRTPPLWSMN